MSKQSEYEAFAAAEQQHRQQVQEQQNAANAAETERRQSAFNEFVQNTTPPSPTN